MDVSKEYIEMCKAAKEIQGGWVASDWDYIYAIDYDMAEVITGTETDGGLYGYDSYHVNDDKKSFIWLPRQDQLQEMVTLTEPLTFTKTGTDECSVHSRTYKGAFHFTDKS